MQITITQSRENLDCAAGKSESFIVDTVLFKQGFGKAVTIAGNQFLPPDSFCQCEGFAGKELGFCPLLAIEGEFRQIAYEGGDAFLKIDFLRNAQGFAVVALGGGVIIVFTFYFRQKV